jgi:hypothetical protein
MMSFAMNLSLKQNQQRFIEETNRVFNRPFLKQESALAESVTRKPGTTISPKPAA